MRSRKLYRILNAVEYGAAAVAGVAILLIMLALLADTIARYAFNGSIAGVSDFAAEYLLMIAIYFSLAYTWRVGQHARVTLFSLDRWPLAKSFARLVNLGVTLIALGMVVFANLQAMQAAQVRGTVSAGSVQFSLWPAYLLICVGAGLFLVTVLVRLGEPEVEESRGDDLASVNTEEGTR